MVDSTMIVMIVVICGDSLMTVIPGIIRGIIRGYEPKKAMANKTFIVCQTSREDTAHKGDKCRHVRSHIRIRYSRKGH